ncbi:MAG TPA: hypothetical protein VF690_16800 [Hymenobacter sp.]|jgi:hypothetical protein
MKAQASCAPALRGDRDLSAPLAAWLRTQGFTAQEEAQPGMATMAAHWINLQLDRFELAYVWQRAPAGHAVATCRLQVLYAHEWDFTTLFTAQRVHRLRDVRALLLGNVRYANARQVALATGALQPA